MNRILVVEDSPTQAAALEQTLVAAGFDVGIARNGLEGWQILNTAAFDLVIADVLMPGLTGDCAEDRRACIPVVEARP